MQFMISIVRPVRDLPIGLKLAATVVGALALLIAISWFALDRLAFVAGFQASITAQAELQQQVQRGLLAAQELRTISREVPQEQTATGIKKALARAAQQREQTTGIMKAVRERLADGSDMASLDQALDRLETLMTAINHEAGLRGDVINLRQKKLFQTRPVFENSLNTLHDELLKGAAAASGVDSVRGNASVGTTANPAFVGTTEDDKSVGTTANDTSVGTIVNPAPVATAANDASSGTTAKTTYLEDLTRYRLAMDRLQNAALMFMATGNPGAANDIRDAAPAAAASMAALLNGDLPDQIKTDARVAGQIGDGIAQASNNLIAMTKQLEQVAGPEVEQASQAMRTAFEALAEAASRRSAAASTAARDATQMAWRQISMIIGAIALLMIASGAAVTAMIAGPIRRLTRLVQAIADGDTRQAVPYTKLRDEVGRMAASVERLRGVMQQTFLQSQMIEQMPVGVMTAEPAGGCRITYLNVEAKRILETVKDALPVALDRLVGQSMDVFHAQPQRQRAILSDPANMPRRLRITIGAETMELRVIPTHDRQGAYAGPLIIWRQLTAQVKLVDQFERSVGAIAHTVSESAQGMRLAASAMRESAVDAGTRTRAVAAASEEASQNVNTAAAAAEQLAASVAEVGRQVQEQARIAAAAVAEAAATDASVSGLSDAAEQIGAVVRLIGDIAGKTNLLALNATIEAARAGEAGKGFAVVAGEVKNLATQTARATQEIGVQINAMRQATGQAVSALRSIAATIQQMNEIAAGIAGSVQEQGAATQAIALAVAQAAMGTSGVDGNIAVVSQAVSETGAKAVTVLDAATALTDQSAVLKQDVETFLAAVQQAA